jgi:RNA-binding protein YlmH
MEDLAERSIKIGMASSKFLTPAEQEIVRGHFSRANDVRFVLESGLDHIAAANDTDASAVAVKCADDRRRLAIFLNPDWGIFDIEKLICAIRIDYRDQDAIGHRDILGALMALGIKREVLGDIISEETPAHLICLSEIAATIRGGITKIGSVGVRLTDVSLSDVTVREEELISKTITAVSLRLDMLVGGGFGVSRNEAIQLIHGGLTALNHIICEKPDRKVAASDVISVRGKGRIKILSVGNMSRKGRTFVEIGIYPTAPRRVAH